MNGSEASGKVKLVNVRQVFHDKNPHLAALLPGFVYRYLERIAHQREINEFLAKHGDKYGLDFARAAIQDFNVTVTVAGEENIPRNSRCIFASNHPLGGFDGILMMEVMSRYFTDFKFLSNDILMNIINLHPLFIPINKHGKQAIESAGKLHEAYLSDTQIVTFPSGLVSRYINGQVMDLEWKKNFITKAIHYQARCCSGTFYGQEFCFFLSTLPAQENAGHKSKPGNVLPGR